MKRFLIAPVMMIAIVFGVIGIGYALKPETAKAETVTMTSNCETSVLGLICAYNEGSQVVLRLGGPEGQVLASLPLSQIVDIPTVTVNVPKTIRVTLPRVTVIRPPVTVRLPGVTLPGQTVTVNLPGATNTVTLQGSTRTVTIDGSQRTVTTIPVTVTGPSGQKITTSVTITPSPVTPKPVVKEREVRVSVPQAIAYGIGALILGLLLGLLAIYLAYVAGYKDSEKAENSAWRNFRNDVFGKKDKGEHE